MMEQQRKGSKYQLFARDSKLAQELGCQPSSGAGSSGLGSKGMALKRSLVSRLGFKFDVANFDINAVSPTSW